MNKLATTSLVCIVVLMLCFSAKAEANHKPFKWMIQTAHLYPEKGLQLRIVAFHEVSVYCVVTKANGWAIASEGFTVRPVQNTVWIEFDRTDEATEFKCYEAEEV